jgi:hypothetical protein
MSLPVPPVIVEAFATAGLKNSIPVPSQISTDPGAASYTDGFPPLTMTPIPSGGIPPSGKDMNGILFAISAHTAWLQAGNGYVYSAVKVAATGGYDLGAILAKVDGSGTWRSAVAANVTDPDAGGAGWVSSNPLYAATAPGAGSHNDVVLPGVSDYVLNVDTSAGDVTFTGFVAQRDGQRIYLTNVGTSGYLLTLAALAGSSALNQIRVPTDLSAITNQTYVLQYSTGAGKWILV